MNGRTFIDIFLKTFHSKAALPCDFSPRNMQDIAELLFNLDDEVDDARVRRAFNDAVDHLMNSKHHVGRSYPRRLEALLADIPPLGELTPEMFGSKLATACACDYIDWPRHKDWRTDESLMSAVGCSVVETMTDILPIAERVERASMILPLPLRLGVLFLFTSAVKDYQAITKDLPELIGRPQSLLSFMGRIVDRGLDEEVDGIFNSARTLLRMPDSEERTDEALSKQIAKLVPARAEARN